MIIGKQTFDFTDNKAYIMGILNITPDSFSDGGSHDTIATALAHAQMMLDQGCDIIDIGAESTRPGHTQISTDEEIRRLVPILEAIRDHFPNVAISVDCYRYETAEVALQHGADMINDIWGLTYDDKIAQVIAKYDGAACIMHNRPDRNYSDLLSDLLADTQHMLNIGLKAGIDPEKICIDPGIGFAKDFTENLITLKHIDAFERFHLPILLGTSRKGFLGQILDLPAPERDLGTAATTVYGYLHGARIFRVHDILANKQALEVARQIVMSDHE